MSQLVTDIKTALQEVADPEKAAFFPSFFKTGPGEYGEGDVFIGVTVPKQRKIVKEFARQATLVEIEELLQQEIHEYRLTALLLLVEKYARSKREGKKQEIVDLYLANTKYINNWDLVDASAEKILGIHYFDKDTSILRQLAKSESLWEQRMAIISTFYFIRNEQYQPTLDIAELLLNHPHDLIHKAVGWMLREVGKKNYDVEYEFLLKHYRTMPRTMLRYAIEKFEPEVRQQFLKGTI